MGVEGDRCAISIRRSGGSVLTTGGCCGGGGDECWCSCLIGVVLELRVMAMEGVAMAERDYVLEIGRAHV